MVTMKCLNLLTLFVLLDIIGVCLSTYILLTPKQFRPGTPYDITINILKARGPTTIKAQLYYTKYDHKTRSTTRHDVTSVISKTFPRGVGILKLKPPAVDSFAYPRYGNYKVSVNGTRGETFTHDQYVSKSWKTVSLFLQTDKGIYKPGQTVKMRLFGVYSNLLPFKGGFNLEIRDPENNKIKNYLGLKDPSGVVSVDLPISDKPLLGTWRMTLNATGHTAKITKTFDVKEYVLPKFEVSIDLPPYSVISHKVIKATVNAKYTFGKPVEGSGILSVKEKPRYRWRENKNAPSIEANFTLVDGKADVIFTLAKLKEVLNKISDRQLEFTANVTEPLTKKKLSGSSLINVYTEAHKITVLPITASNFKPGLNYFAYFKVSQQDDSPVVNPKPVNAEIKFFRREIRTRYINDRLWGRGSQRRPCKEVHYEEIGKSIRRIKLSAEGVAELNVIVRKNTDRITITAKYEKAVTTRTAEKMYSTSNNYIQLSLLTNKVVAGRKATFSLRGTELIRSFVYQIFSRGKPILSRNYRVYGTKKTVRFSVMITPQMGPSARMVVHYFRQSKEVVADAINFKVDGAIPNKVSLKFSKSLCKPGEKNVITVSADRGSIAYVAAVDQSVILLKKGNDVTKEQVKQELASYDNTYRPYYSRYWWPSFISGADVRQIFQNSGTNVLTNDADIGQNRKRFYSNCYRRRVGGGGWRFRLSSRARSRSRMGLPGISVARTNTAAKTASASKLKPVERVRLVFPETFLWYNATIGYSGKATTQFTVPDTITSWHASAFAIHSRTGLGVVDSSTKFTVFKPFFVSLNLPYSVIRGEQVIIQVLVFNYVEAGPDKLSVRVTLEKSDGYKVLSGASVQNVQVPKGKSKSVSFPIEPTKLGPVDIKVNARSSLAADAVQRPLLVEAEGIPDEYSKTVIVDLKEVGKYVRKTVPISLPAGFVPDTDKVIASVVGDFLGPTISGLDQLIKQPYGCGEQNMVNFVPNILVVKYLKKINKLPNDLFMKAKLHMEQGYQRELTYKHKDGSYSAFGGKNGRPGSLWLTAFVMKSFHQAKPYIYIDDAIMEQGLGFMVKHQNTTTGEFVEQGSVHSTWLKGGSSGQGVPLTAFVLIALFENRDIQGKLQDPLKDAIIKATGYLEREALTKTSNPYMMAITAYSLALVESPKANLFYRKLNQLATIRNGLKYWSKPVPKNKWRYRPRSLNTEMTAYALSTCALKKDVNVCLPILRWITKQRNSNGGFTSTQDTVISLQALTEYGHLVSSGKTDLSIELESIGLYKPNKIQFYVNEANKVSTQLKQLPATPKKVKVVAKGKGFAIVQISVQYNIMKLEVPDAFFVKADILHEDKNKIQVKACTRYLKSGSSRMTIMELGIPTGFEADVENVGEVSGLEKIEKEDRKLVLYFDQIGQKKTCVIFDAERVALVAKTQPAAVKVYDYYSPEDQATAYYLPKILAKTTVCDLCENCTC